MATFIYPRTQVSITGVATEATQLLVLAELVDVNAELNTQTPILTDIETNTASVDSKISNDYGASSGAVRTAAQIGNASGAADFGAGNSSAQTLRAVIATDQAPIDVSGPLTDAELRATPVDVLGPLTDTELRATPVPVSGPLTDTQLRATPVDVLGPLTDTELRATPVPVSGPLTDTQLRATPVDVLGPLTDTELRASAVPVSVASLPLPTGAATETTLALVEAALSLDVVDQLDSVLLDTSGTNIPASSGNPLQVVASSAADIKKIISVEDIGEFIAVYKGPALSEVLVCILPLGGGEIEVQIPSGTRISLRNMKNTAISSGFIALNFLG